MDARELIAQFESGTLPKSLWTLPDLPFESLVEKLVNDSRFKDTAYIKQFYDGETLKSARARATYVPPGAAVDNARPAHG